MTDIIRLKQQEAVLRLLFQNEHKDVEKRLRAQKNVATKRDCLTISSEAMEIQKTAQIYGQSENIKFDQTVDIASYFEAAREANQKTLENAGDEITRSRQKCPYVSSGEVCYQILTDKYSKLIEEAKKHDDPELYIERKYYDPTCPWFTSDLTREERSIGYRNEMSMLKRGKVVGANMLDSVFRINNLTLEYNEINASQISYYRQLCDAQLNFIFSKNKIEVGEASQYIFRVDPYSYYISVDCEDAAIKGKMESVLNQGENGKHLWQQINWFSEQDGAHSAQISNKLSIDKTWAYREVYRYTGYQLHELKEENGTYYTEDGTDIKTVIREEVWKDPIFPYEAKEDYAQAVCGCIQEVAEWGWQNVPDMVLSIGYSSAGLHDLGQDISFDYGSEWYKQYLDNYQYSVLATY